MKAILSPRVFIGLRGQDFIEKDYYGNKSNRVSVHDYVISLCHFAGCPINNRSR